MHKMNFRSFDDLTTECNDQSKEIDHICNTNQHNCVLNSYCSPLTNPEHHGIEPLAPHHQCTCNNGFAYFPEDSEIEIPDDHKIPGENDADITPPDDPLIYPKVILLLRTGSIIFLEMRTSSNLPRENGFHSSTFR